MGVPITVTHSTLDYLSADLLRISREQVAPRAPVIPVDPVNPDTAGKGSARQQQNQQQGQNLGSLVRVQASLSPSEELEVFASATLDTQNAILFPPPPIDNPPSLVKTTIANLAAIREVQEKKDAHDALLADQTNADADKAALTEAATNNAGVQAFAAYLYARNNDIVFNAAPVAQLAA